MYHQIAFDQHFIKSTLGQVAKVDDFTRQLMEIYDETFDSMQRIQPTILTIQRADYMFDEKPGSKGGPKLKQVRWIH